MALFRFKGQNASGFVRCYGKTFVVGAEPVEVDDPVGIKKLRKHPEFEEAKPKAAPPAKKAAK